QFEDEAQFAPLAEGLARRAADEVRRLRTLFPSVPSAAEHLAARSPRGFWDTFHAGVASGLAGDPARGRGYFDEVACTDDWRDWPRPRRRSHGTTPGGVGDLPAFRHRIEGVLRRARGLLRLPEIAGPILE